jgi:hypothetical protein
VGFVGRAPRPPASVDRIRARVRHRSSRLRLSHSATLDQPSPPPNSQPRAVPGTRPGAGSPRDSRATTPRIGARPQRRRQPGAQVASPLHQPGSGTARTASRPTGRSTPHRPRAGGVLAAHPRAAPGPLRRVVVPGYFGVPHQDRPSAPGRPPPLPHPAAGRGPLGLGQLLLPRSVPRRHPPPQLLVPLGDQRGRAGRLQRPVLAVVHAADPFHSTSRPPLLIRPRPRHPDEGTPPLRPREGPPDRPLVELGPRRGGRSRLAGSSGEEPGPRSPAQGGRRCRGRGPTAVRLGSRVAVASPVRSPAPRNSGGRKWGLGVPASPVAGRGGVGIGAGGPRARPTPGSRPGVRSGAAPASGAGPGVRRALAGVGPPGPRGARVWPWGRGPGARAGPAGPGVGRPGQVPGGGGSRAGRGVAGPGGVGDRGGVRPGSRGLLSSPAAGCNRDRVGGPDG